MIIKNLKLKFFIYNNIFPVLSWINKMCRHDDNKIFLYCNLSFRDNNRAIYDHLIPIVIMINIRLLYQHQITKNM